MLSRKKQNESMRVGKNYLILRPKIKIRVAISSGNQHSEIESGHV